jgi:histidine phosphotransferase ChpT
MTKSAVPATHAAMDSVDLASLLCSRLCHDLMSPVGALNNGIELLADEQDPDMRDRCMDLLSESARATANKLKFFRLAFGAAGGFGDAVDTKEALMALEGLLGGERKIQLDWMVADEKLSKGATKLLLNLALIAVDALVRGGRLDIGVEKNSGVEIAIRAEGPRIALDDSIRETLLKGAECAVEARTAGAWLAHSLAAEGGGEIQLNRPSDDVLVIGAALPGHS